MFNTLETEVTDYDGNIYPIVQIGDQVWMAENLKTTHYADGTALLDGTGLSTNPGFGKYWFGRAKYGQSIAEGHVDQIPEIEEHRNKTDFLERGICAGRRANSQNG